MAPPLGERHFADAGELIVTLGKAAITPVMADEAKERPILSGREMGCAPVIVAKMQR
jgi:hypothetical protein